MQVYARYGVGLPHHAASQPAYGKRISASEAKPGDLFFYGSGSSISHVGIYIGNIFEEAKNRPLYVIAEALNEKE